MQNDNLMVKNNSGKKRQIIFIGLIILSVVLAVLAIWAFVSYLNQKADVDSKINNAVAFAQKAQADSDEVKFAEREKTPNREFVGPDDYGQVTFNYPKTWSLYIKQDASKGGTYEAVFNPISVNSSSLQYALRVTIEQRDYDKALASFDPLVKNGSLKVTSVSANGNNGTRLDGAFSKDIHGALVLFKIRDKTLTIRTDADTFKSDFNALVTTIKFNQ